MNISEIYRRFPTEQDCISYLEKVRWKGKPACPYCQSTNQTPMSKEKRYHCNTCNTSFSVTVRTIFHKTKLPLQKWFLAICLVLNAKKGISARQLARDLKVNKDTAWNMSKRIREAVVNQRVLFLGIAQMHKTNIGDKNSLGCSGGGGLNNRGKVRQYHRANTYYLNKYVNEFSYGYNNKNNNDIFDQNIYNVLGGIT